MSSTPPKTFQTPNDFYILNKKKAEVAYLPLFLAVSKMQFLPLYVGIHFAAFFPPFPPWRSLRLVLKAFFDPSSSFS